jgi:hypothetical protein
MTAGSILTNLLHQWGKLDLCCDTGALLHGLQLNSSYTSTRVHAVLCCLG